MNSSEIPNISLDDVANLPIVVIDWWDAVCSGSTSWQSYEDIEEAASGGPSKVRTVGMLLVRAPNYVAVCDTLMLDGDSGGYVHVIPSGMIEAIRVMPWPES